MAGMMRHQPPSEEAAITEVAAELSRRGCQAAPALRDISGIDLYALIPRLNRRLSLRVLGNPRYNRRGRPEWLVGVWKFQSRPRTETGLPFFRHPYYPGFWILWEFPTQCDFTVFVWPQEDQGARPRFFVAPTSELRQLLSDTPVWAENYHGVRDRPCWVGMDVVGRFEERWEWLEEIGS